MVHAGTAPDAETADDEISAFLAEKAALAREIAPAALDLVTEAARYTRGGKRFRARLVRAGFECASSGAVSERQEAALPAIQAAIEFFHAAALMHDDIIDESSRRRGEATSHIALADLHRSRSFAGDAGKYGESAAILLGDLLLMWSDELFDRGLSRVTGETHDRLKSIYHRMREDVTIGQYLDVEAESSWPSTNPAERLERAYTVLTYKSAKYSVEAPLLLGAVLGGANDELLRELSRVALPVGIAFQLRDDVLGVMGDPAVTGKPSGDDIRSGKRTVILALVERALDNRSADESADARRTLEAALGRADASEAKIAAARDVFEATGAIAETERRITVERETALQRLRGLPISASAAQSLEALSVALTKRAS